MSNETGAPGRTPFSKRILRAAALDSDVYEEVEADPAAISEAVIVVALACIASGVGFYLRAATGDYVLADARSLPILAIIAGLEPVVIWFGASVVSYATGATIFRGPETESDLMEVLRTTGFAFGPACLAIFSFIPPDALGLAILLGARVWNLAATIVAIRQALDFTTARAIASFGTGVAILWGLLWMLSGVAQAA